MIQVKDDSGLNLMPVNAISFLFWGLQAIGVKLSAPVFYLLQDVFLNIEDGIVL